MFKLFSYTFINKEKETTKQKNGAGTMTPLTSHLLLLLTATITTTTIAC
jgi:hypothetical protein